MKERYAVPLEQLRRVWNPDELGFSSTAEIPALEGLVGQERAVASLQFGLSMCAPGYNIYVAGPSGTGKTSYTTALVRSHATTRKVPNDWVYVHNFDRPDEPSALSFPPGMGPTFAREMEELIADAQATMSRALNSKEYHGQRDEVLQQLQAQVSQVMEELEKMAAEAGFALTETERGLMPVPVADGQPLTEEQFAALTPEMKHGITERAQRVQAAINEAARQTWEQEKSLQAQLKQLDTQVTQRALSPIVGHLRDRYRHLPRVVEWLNRVEQELAGYTVPNPAAAKAMEEAASAANMVAMPGMRKRRLDPFAQFRVNVIVHRHKKQGAPVIIETNPTYANLFGTAEFVSPEEPGENGVMHIKAGAIHRANGGYLILQASDVLSSPFAWEALKRALATREARIEVPGQESRAVPIESVRPQPIPLDAKVILIGSSGIYHMLYAVDEGFRKQFKLKAEFDVAMDASPANISGYAEFISSVCRRENLKHFSAAAVSQVIQHSHRLADDQEKLSAQFNEVVEVIYEANAWARQAGSEQVEAEHVRQAVREKAARSALPEVGMREMIQRGTILVDVDGSVVGQVNGLTVMTTGDFSFGSPSRITARTYMGQKGILHIEREIAMSGQIHDKGVFTLSAFLGDRFAQEKPLTFSASIAFEQTYVPVDGDSASSTELYALLSALADAPIDQGIAVTGSVNQRGQIQPIGGVNQKVEGFFRVCQLLGLTGRQGVMIPRRNVANLMLSDEVADAVKAGQFNVWAVDTIEEGIEILTGLPAGERGPDGRYSPGSLFDRVDRRIESLARKLSTWNHCDPKD